MPSRGNSWAMAALIALMLVASAWVWLQLPPGSRVAVHFDAQGRPNGWADASFGLFIVPGIAVAMWLLRLALPRIDPRGHNLVRSAKAYGTIWLTVTLVLAFGQWLILAAALGHELRLGGQMLAVIGLLYVVLGNVMGKLRQNYTVGIRTPWTLADERVWDQTHRFGGRVMVAGGFALLVCAFLPALHEMQVALVLAATIAITLAVCAKSYLLWRARDANRF